MSKIIQARKKVVSVLNITTFTLLTISTSYILSRQNSDASYKIAGEIAKNLCDKNETIYLDDQADNGYLLLLFEEHLKDSIFLTKEKSKIWLAKKAGNNNVSDDSDYIREIFSEENYRHIKSQVVNNKWEREKIKKYLKCTIFADSDKKSYPYLRISTPMYTIKNQAVVYYKFKSSMGLTIYEKNGKDWIQKKMIPLGIE